MSEGKNKTKKKHQDGGLRKWGGEGGRYNDQNCNGREKRSAREREGGGVRIDNVFFFFFFLKRGERKKTVK